MARSSRHVGGCSTHKRGFVLLLSSGAALMLSIRSYYKRPEYLGPTEAFESVFSQMFKSDARALSFDSLPPAC